MLVHTVHRAAAACVRIAGLTISLKLAKLSARRLTASSAASGLPIEATHDSGTLSYQTQATNARCASSMSAQWCNWVRLCERATQSATLRI